MEITADTDCTIEVYHCLRPINFFDNRPTWNEYDPDSSTSWSSPGGLGTGDSVYAGSVELIADTPGSFSSTGLTDALQEMVDGAERTFLLRRSDTGGFGVGTTANVTIEFDLDTPPN